jgi:hypothetical protein
MSKQEPPGSHRAAGAGALMRLSHARNVRRSADGELAAIQDDTGRAEAPI